MPRVTGGEGGGLCLKVFCLIDPFLFLGLCVSQAISVNLLLPP